MNLLWKPLFAVLAFASVATAAAQTFPSRQVRFIVGFPVATTNDLFARILAADISKRAQVDVLVDPRANQADAFGVELALRAPPDGYTVMLSTSDTFSAGPHLSKLLNRLDPVKDLSHISRVARFDFVLVTPPNGPKNAKALTETAAAKPEGLTYGYGTSIGRVAASTFAQAAGIKVRSAQFRTQPAAVSELGSGTVDLVATQIYGNLIPGLRNGKVNAVAVFAEKRSSFLPDVPTAVEAGLPHLDLSGWVGLAGPADFPAEAAAWWAEQVRLSLASPEMQEKLRQFGMEPAPLSGDAFKRFVEGEHERWGRYVRAAGMQPE